HSIWTTIVREMPRFEADPGASKHDEYLEIVRSRFLDDLQRDLYEAQMRKYLRPAQLSNAELLEAMLLEVGQSAVFPFNHLNEQWHQPQFHVRNTPLMAFGLMPGQPQYAILFRSV